MFTRIVFTRTVITEMTLTNKVVYFSPFAKNKLSRDLGKILFILWISFSLSACQFIKIRSPITVSGSIKKVRASIDKTKNNLAGPGIENTNWAEDSETHNNLISLPKPKGKILVSAYGFRDQSGQYKQSPSSGFSTAVSQGANAILVKAVKDSGWFVPIEREALQNLLTERKIIRAGLKGRAGDIPPLLGASILFEGGIIGYDTNIKTGGAGAKYFGLGTAEQYKVDQVTVSLRAIDIYSGKIINTVVINKSIFSKETTAGFYRFVRFKRLLEMEAGYTNNEPVQLALVDAIETAVLKMVVDGIKFKLWSLANPADIKHPIVQKYLDPRDKTNAPSLELVKKIMTKTEATKIDLQTSLATNRPPIVKPTPPPTSTIPTIKTATKKPHIVMTKKTAPSQVVRPFLPASASKPALPVALNRQTSAPLNLISTTNITPMSGPYYTIQLISSREAIKIVDFITDTQLKPSDLRLFNYNVNGSDQYALLYGSFTEKSDALEAIKKLPESIKAHGPWLRIINNSSE